MHRFNCRLRRLSTVSRRVETQPQRVCIPGIVKINYHPQSGWFEDAPLKGGAVRAGPLRGRCCRSPPQGALLWEALSEGAVAGSPPSGGSETA
jgi:hypothetical protein